jgi:hypothetical protein
LYEGFVKTLRKSSNVEALEKRLKNSSFNFGKVSNDLKSNQERASPAMERLNSVN